MHCFKNFIVTVIIFQALLQPVYSINPDSLWNTWSNEQIADSIRLKAIDEYAWEVYGYSDPDSAHYFAQLQYDFAAKHGYKYWMARALNTQGNSLVIRGLYLQAYAAYENALLLFEETGDKQGIANTEHRIGIIYFYQGDNPRALDHYLRALKLREEIGDKKGISASLNNIGIVYSQQLSYDQALDYFTRSLAISKETNDRRGEASALNNIGLIHKSKNDPEKAFEYFNRSLKISESLGDKRDIAASLNNIGAVYEIRGELDKAFDYYNQSVELKKEIDDKQGISLSLSSIGTILRKQKKYHEAIEWCQQSLDAAETIGILQEQVKACECMYQSYKSLKQEDKALAFHEKMLILNDSLKAEETSGKLRNMEFARQLLIDSIARAEERLRVKLAHEEEVERKNKLRNVMLGVMGLFIIGGIAMYSRIRYIRKSRTELAREKAQSENLLLNILPREIAQELKDKGTATSRKFDDVSILFTDFKEFTRQSSQLSPEELVAELNTAFRAFDEICSTYNIEKIKTIGDAYMAAGGLPVSSPDSMKRTVLAALAMNVHMKKQNEGRIAKGKEPFEMRVGIHTGPVVAGIVGVKKFQYDVWGDTVNLASRIEGAGEVDKVNISRVTYEHIKNEPGFEFEYRGKMDVKGKGEIEMYFVSLK